MTYFFGKDMSNYPSQEMDRFNVRLPAGMRDAIAERAKANGRSMNSEIVQILEDALNNESNYSGGLTHDEAAELTGLSIETIEKLTKALKESTELINRSTKLIQERLKE